MALSWKPKHIEIANLIKEGKTEKEIRALGYSQNMFFRVKRALDNGESPDKPVPKVRKKEEVLVSSTKTISDSGAVGLTQPLGGITQDEVVPEKYQIQGNDLEIIHDQYRDLQTELSWDGSYSSTVREAMKLYRTTMLSFLLPNKHLVPVENDDKKEDHGEELDDDDATGADS